MSPHAEAMHFAMTKSDYQYEFKGAARAQRHKGCTQKFGWDDLKIF